jgi:hypothetical protein
MKITQIEIFKKTICPINHIVFAFLFLGFFIFKAPHTLAQDQLSKEMFELFHPGTFVIYNRCDGTKQFAIVDKLNDHPKSVSIHVFQNKSLDECISIKVQAKDISKIVAKSELKAIEKAYNDIIKKYATFNSQTGVYYFKYDTFKTKDGNEINGRRIYFSSLMYNFGPKIKRSDLIPEIKIYKSKNENEATQLTWANDRISQCFHYVNIPHNLLYGPIDISNNISFLEEVLNYWMKKFKKLYNKYTFIHPDGRVTLNHIQHNDTDQVIYEKRVFFNMIRIFQPEVDIYFLKNFHTPL